MGCMVSANEYSCAHYVTFSPNKLWRSTSIFNLWFEVTLVYRRRQRKICYRCQRRRLSVCHRCQRNRDEIQRKTWCIAPDDSISAITILKENFKRYLLKFTASVNNACDRIVLGRGSRVTKRCCLSLLTLSTLVYESQCWGIGVAWSQQMSTAVHITWHGAQINFGDLPPCIFNLWFEVTLVYRRRQGKFATGPIVSLPSVSKKPETKSKEKHGVWGPILELTITFPYVDSRVDTNTFTTGNPMPESTLFPSQGLRI
jgi:hypothetical protein